GTTGQSSLQSAFDTMLGSGNTVVLGPAAAASGSVYTVVFTSAFGNANLPQMFPRITGAGTLTAATVSDGVAYNELQSVTLTGAGNEVQTLTLTSGNNDLGGNFTVTFGGQTSAAIAFNATAATVQAALEAMSSIGVGNIAVVGSSGTSGGTYFL